jgi:predicted negative regulator of RcsB-dependent stress response
MKKGAIVVIIIVIIIGGLVGYRILKLNKKPTPESINRGNKFVSQPAKVSEEELKTQYESKVKEILKPFWTSQDAIGIKEKLLELTVPYVYKDLHLELIIAFSLIDSGRVESDQGKIEEGLKKLEELKQEYEWLKEISGG